MLDFGSREDGALAKTVSSVSARASAFIFTSKLFDADGLAGIEVVRAFWQLVSYNICCNLPKGIYGPFGTMPHARTSASNSINVLMHALAQRNFVPNPGL